ncbi:polysaccharide biosynthesis/export family protein [Nafulsella turpanensis]|uniref:polysaccharide biosynthesis/export family protein n=1 Tax=Nafulsella turpanensis TaxID=1265690 RepID=UPI00034A2DAC|nr:polysaccharide biosynthesis/export family protein [Nafulsella turpanensis]
MTKFIFRLICFGLIAGLAGSCRAYKQDIMLRVEDLEPGMLKMEVAEAERNYTIQPDDLLEVAVYTNKGERIIDPDFALMRELGAGTGQAQQNRSSPKYLVQENGLVKLPMIGEIELEGYTLPQADSVLSRAYNEYYKESFVLTSFVNKRVVVLGATGGMVIPLPNENMSLLEVLALAGGIAGKGKAYNIRLISGDLDNPQVQLIDLSTIEGMRQASLQVHSGDIVYVEPMRKVLTETIRDITPVVSLVTSALTLLVIIVNLNP